MPVGLCNEAAELLIQLPAVCEQEILVDGMESDDIIPRNGTLLKLLPALVAEHSFNEIIPEHGIAKASLLFNRHHGKPLHEGTCKQASAFAVRHPMPVEDPNPFDPAAGRILLEDVSREVKF